MKRALLIAVGWSLVVSACGSSPSPSSLSLDGTTWQAVLVAGQAPVAGRQPTIAFRGDAITGTTGCNSYGGKLRLIDGHWQADEISMTEIGCPGDIGRVEALFTAALGAVADITVVGDRLALRGARGEIQFVRLPAPAP